MYRNLPALKKTQNLKYLTYRMMLCVLIEILILEKHFSDSHLSYLF